MSASRLRHSDGSLEDIAIPTRVMANKEAGARTRKIKRYSTYDPTSAKARITVNIGLDRALPSRGAFIIAGRP